jgi:uncharacterized membrane protein
VIEGTLRVGTGISLALLVAGMLLWVATPGTRADLVLNAGLVLLLATPVMKLLSVIADELRARDWRFAALGLAVLALLAGSVAIAVNS